MSAQDPNMIPVEPVPMGPAFFTDSYLGENPPDLLERIGVARTLQEHGDEDIAALFEPQAEL